MTASILKEVTVRYFNAKDIKGKRVRYRSQDTSEEWVAVKVVDATKHKLFLEYDSGEVVGLTLHAVLTGNADIEISEA